MQQTLRPLLHQNLICRSVAAEWNHHACETYVLVGWSINA
jgi:hypothetical protein